MKKFKDFQKKNSNHKLLVLGFFLTKVSDQPSFGTSENKIKRKECYGYLRTNLPRPRIFNFLF